MIIIIHSYQMSATTVTPKNFGANGGMDVTVNGNGFGSNKDDVTVKFGTDDCVVKSVEMTKIICTTPVLSDGTYDVNVSHWMTSLDDENQIKSNPSVEFCRSFLDRLIN